MQVTYDPSKVSYKELLEVFMDGHNPTQANGQGNDSGSQYRGGIYTHTAEQKEEAQAFLKEAQSRYQVSYPISSAFYVIDYETESTVRECLAQ